MNNTEIAVRFARIENRLADIEKALWQLTEHTKTTTIAEFAVKAKELSLQKPS